MSDTRFVEGTQPEPDHRQVVRDLSPYKEAMDRLLRALTHQLKTCYPRPLAIDGHAYHRKTRARRNRR